jgi:hypothetical protein
MDFGLIFILVISFIVGVFVTRWIFRIDKIINSLELQNERSLVQIRLLKKMLLIQGVPFDEIDGVIDNGNVK